MLQFTAIRAAVTAPIEIARGLNNAARKSDVRPITSRAKPAIGTDQITL